MVFNSLPTGGAEYFIILGIFFVFIFFPGEVLAEPSEFEFKISDIVYLSSISDFGANVGFTVTSTSNGNPVSPTCTPSSTSLFPVGKTSVLCSATDTGGNFGTASFQITVGGTDTVAPTITPPPDVSEFQTGELTMVDLGNPFVNDNIDESPLIFNDYPVPEFPLGDTVVTWTAMDHSGNFNTATQNVNIKVFVQVTVDANPVGGSYNAAQNVVLTANEPEPIYYTIGGTNPTTSSAIYSSPIPISSSKTIKFFAEVDSEGNPLQIESETYTIDASPPVITRIGSSPVYVLQGSTYNDGGATASDNLDGDLTSSIVTVNPVNTSILGNYTVTYNVTDQTGNPATQVTRTVKVISSDTTTWMSDVTSPPFSGLSTHSGRPIHAEFVSPTSSLVGKSIDTIKVKLSKTGSPTGIVEAGIFNTDLSVKKLFGTISATSVAGSYTDYTFSLSIGQAYQIQSGDRIGIKFSGGDASNSVNIARDADPADPFDGANSYRTYYVTTWQSFTAEDLHMILQVNDSAGLGDTTPPVITLVGSNPINVQFGTTYNDSGATASDNIDGNITPSIVTVNPVNTSVLGIYTVTYNVNDSAGNSATQVTRTVNVVDNSSPTVTPSPTPGLYNSVLNITLSPSTPSIIYYTIDGTTPTTSSPVYNTGITINASTTVKSLAKTFTGNSGPISNHSYIIDTISPVITINGNPEVLLNLDSTYVDAGATASDNLDGDLTSSIITVNPVNSSVLGTYIVTYDVTDQAGNAAIQDTRRVRVLDLEPPQITILGDNPVQVSLGSSYVDEGATAIDNVDGDLTNLISVSNPVNPTVPGRYQVTYDVFDQAENFAIQAVRIVDVVAPACIPPQSGSWTITSSCLLTSNAIIQGTLTIQNNSIVIIPKGVTLYLDFKSFNLVIKQNSGIQIEFGGTINQS